MRKLSKLKTGLLIAVALVLAAAVTWWAIRPPVVRVQGRGVEARIRGNGSPIVIFELGSAGGNLSYWKLQNAVARITKTLVYERAGLGRSDLSDGSGDAEVYARQLHELLGATGLPPPYVLVGHSYGGLLIRVFAHRYPDEIHGLVFLDSATEDMYRYMKEHSPTEWAAAEHAMGPGFQNQWRALPQTLQQATAAWPLPSVPTTFLVADKPLGQWPLVSEADVTQLRKGQEALRAKIPGATWVPISDSTHMSILLKDQAANEIIRLVDRARGGAP
jgi:pimeloyl-ACP methyl ester carboxylesterase